MIMGLSSEIVNKVRPDGSTILTDMIKFSRNYSDDWICTRLQKIIMEFVRRTDLESLMIDSIAQVEGPALYLCLREKKPFRDGRCEDFQL